MTDGVVPPGTTTNDGDAIRDDIGVGKRHARDTTSNATTIGAGEEAATATRRIHGAIL